MPYLYVYNPSDFVGGLPNESDAQASGSPNFVLTLTPGATPTLIEVTDDDLIFDEVDLSQVLTNAVNIDGSNVAAGTSINTAYDLINTTTGHKVTSFHFGGDGYQQGAVDGLVSTIPLTAGSSYIFNSERTSHQYNNAYDDYVACFVAGSRIATQQGLKDVGDLAAGDMIQTLDHGFRPLRVILKRHLTRTDLHAKPNLLPVRISKESLGQGVPKRDILVSPQHRFLANSPIVKRMFGTAEVLISAKKLTMLPGISVAREIEDVVYYHLVLDRHEVVFVEGAPTESFFCGPMAILGLSAAARDEIELLFPKLKLTAPVSRTARQIPSSKRQSKLALRHERNEKFVLARASQQTDLHI